jgi:phosphate transport system substrate-binding protein
MEEAKARRKARRNVKVKVKAKGKANAAGALLVILALGTIVGMVPATWAETPTGLSGSLTIAGSTTVLPINQECARLLMVANPDLRISVSGGGSGHGVEAAGAGEIDIGAVSRDVKSSELEKYPDLKPVAIGKDSVAIVVHPSNSISDLTLEQAAKIFSGEITNWKDVGGADAAIRVITREAGSGTRETFETYVMTPLKKETAAKAFVKASNDLYLVTKGTPSALEQAFINFVLSSEGQRVIEDMGYIEIGAAVTPSPTPTPTAMLTATPTPMPTTTPTTTTPTPTEPGFEAVAAIGGLLAVSYLAVRSRKKD